MLCMGVRTPDVALASHGLHETSWVRFTEPKGKVVARAAFFGACVTAGCLHTESVNLSLTCAIQIHLLHVFHPTTTTDVFAIDLFSKGHETSRGSSKFHWKVKN